MTDNKDKKIVSTGFPSTGFPAVSNLGFPAKATGFPASTGFSVLSADEDEVDTDEPQPGKAPRDVKYFEGVNKLNKTETKYAWTEFGGERLATYEDDGSGYITRVIERASKKTGVYFKITELLTKDADGYGTIDWRIELGTVMRRKPAKQKFEEAWSDSILESVRSVIADGENVSAAARKLAEELGVSFSTMRANIWVADKWSRGETTTFLPHRTMIKPIFNLMCELGKEEETLEALIGYSKAVKKPSSYVEEIMEEHGLM